MHRKILTIAGMVIIGLSVFLSMGCSNRLNLVKNGTYKKEIIHAVHTRDTLILHYLTSPAQLWAKQVLKINCHLSVVPKGNIRHSLRYLT